MEEIKRVDLNSIFCKQLHEKYIIQQLVAEGAFGYAYFIFLFVFG